MSQNLLQWTVADVASYFSAAGFPEQAVAFRTQVSAHNRHRGRCVPRKPFQRQVIWAVLRVQMLRM